MREASRVQTLRRNHKLKKLAGALLQQDMVEDSELGVVDLGANKRVDALIAAAELGDTRAMEAVMRRLDDPDRRVRAEAVRTVRALDPAQARSALIQGLISWPDPPFDEARAEALRTLEKSDDPAVAEQVIEAIASTNGSAVLDRTTRSAVVALASEVPRGGAPTDLIGGLIDRLRDADGNRRNVEILLAWLGEYSVDDLIDGLGDPALRESAATVLGALREARAVPGLVACFDDERPEVRLAAAGALAEIRDVRSVDGLIRAVSDPDYDVRLQAQRALDALGTVGIVAGVAAVLTIMRERNGDEPPILGPGQAPPLEE
jgi:HEAT repeat protein